MKERTNILDKNKLYAGDVDVNFVIDKIRRCNQDENYHPRYSSDADDNISHTFIIDDWYIKYILKGGVVHIISVHEDDYHD